MQNKSNAGYLLALHSSTKNFGVAVLDLNDPKKIIKSSVFEAGIKLSNNLFKYIESLLPAYKWQNIVRIALATGPGSFTGTRITIAMARTLAQQLPCQIDGISSFELIATRLSKSLKTQKIKNNFWITQKLKRRGIIAGQYQISKNQEASSIEIVELKKPYLLKKDEKVEPALDAIEDVSQDIKILINMCLKFHLENKNSHSNLVLPIYPTSPVEIKS